MPSDLAYVALLFVLFVVPKLLQRYRLPSAITSLLLGISATGLGLFPADATIDLLSTMGIVALFLLAGLDVDLDELKPDLPVLFQHLAIWIVTLAATAWAAGAVFDLSFRAATLLALAIITPSNGFILDSLDRFGLSPTEKRWVKSKAIGTELIALSIMFVTLRSGSFQELALSLLALILLIVLLPPVFRWFAATITPYAPRSEFAFLLMVALICASVTRHLGVYYLVGAFIAGLAARQFRERLPAMSSDRMLGAVESFASVFIPFYFFRAGQEILIAELAGLAMIVGGTLLLVFVTLRLGEVALHRRIALKEQGRHAARIGLTLIPTLVFSLVLTEVLRDRFIVPGYLLGGLVIYTVLNTLLPGLILGVQPASYEEHHIDSIKEESENGVQDL